MPNDKHVILRYYYSLWHKCVHIHSEPDTPMRWCRVFSYPDNPSEAAMARTLESTPQLRAAYALSQSRKHRHHRECRCRMYAGSFCSAADAMWQEKLNIALQDYQNGRP